MCTKVGPMATSSEAATPVSFTHSPTSLLLNRDELDQGLHGLFGVLPLCPYGYLVALLRAKGHDLQRALGVRFAPVFDHHDLRGISLGRLDELGRRAGVETVREADRCFFLYHLRYYVRSSLHTGPALAILHAHSRSSQSTSASWRSCRNRAPSAPSATR